MLRLQTQKINKPPWGWLDNDSSSRALVFFQHTDWNTKLHNLRTKGSPKKQDARRVGSWTKRAFAKLCFWAGLKWAWQFKLPHKLRLRKETIRADIYDFFLQPNSRWLAGRFHKATRFRAHATRFGSKWNKSMCIRCFWSSHWTTYLLPTKALQLISFTYYEKSKLNYLGTDVKLYFYEEPYLIPQSRREMWYVKHMPVEIPYKSFAGRIP